MKPGEVEDREEDDPGQHELNDKQFHQR
jgi:hypothetical protein